MRAAAGALAALAFAVAGGCAAGDAAPQATLVWRGTVRVKGVERVPDGTTLEIRPGTRVLFAFGDPDGDGQGDAGILVEGGILAEGTPEEPIVFEAEEGGDSPARWGEIRIESTRLARFAHCRFRGARTAIHAHFAALQVESCRVEGNLVGVRFRGDPVRIRGSLLSGNGTAIRYWESSPRIMSNVIRGNGTGIFCRQGSPATVVRGNSLLDNRDYHIKLGELQSRDVDARYNYWGDGGRSEIEEKVFDRNDESYLGRVIYEPREARPPAAAGDAEGPS